MITVILEDANRKELSRVERAGNESYLIQEEPAYQYMSRISDIDYDVFASDEMPGLVRELQEVRIKLKNPDDVVHIESIIALAKQAQKMHRATLTFTPWGDEEANNEGAIEPSMPDGDGRDKEK